MKNKKGMTLTIGILAIATVVLCTYALFAFNLRIAKLNQKVEIASLENVFIIEEVLNYNVNNMMEKSSGGSTEEFISSFRQELFKYKSGGEYVPYQLSQVEGQLTPENVRIENGKVFLTLTFKIEGDVNDKVYASYAYTKIFEKEIENI
ncbi:hypothetical protein A3K73_00120 [Candidatus Pacearchaeota archaeon RBG_13_36_9]|nr:MAG: hypothetical protein A3K73_00120 [Candidatus Pacearchaeota archaeon RBG_13_36_9]